MSRMSRVSRFSRRVFVIDDHGAIRRIPSAKYERLYHRDAAAVFPEYAGQIVRCAVGDVEIIDGRPTEIMALDYILLHFDGSGALDRNKEAKRERLADQIIRAMARATDRHPFAGLDHPACKRFSAEFGWMPTAETAAALSQLALTSSSTGYAARRGSGETAIVSPLKARANCP